MKHSTNDDPRIPDLTEGIKAAKRILERANEALNKAEMVVVVEELKDRVEDWKGHDLAHFGALLCAGQFTVVKGDAKGDVEREV